MYHLGLQMARLGYRGPWPDILLSGVDVFFVISGFIMWVTTARRGQPLEFYRHRLARIVPLYWLVTTAVVAILVVAPGAVQSGKVDVWHIVASYLFIPVVHPVTGLMQPVLVPGWTLNYEMFFYALFGVSLLLPRMTRLLALIVVLGGLAALGHLPVIAPASAAEFYTRDIVLEFALGAGAAAMYLYLAETTVSAATACLVLVSPVSAYGPDLRF
jgi:peptidoglycan/LPS O-acetylase OafA/YrhL